MATLMKGSMTPPVDEGPVILLVQYGVDFNAQNYPGFQQPRPVQVRRVEPYPGIVMWSAHLTLHRISAWSSWQHRIFLTDVAWTGPAGAFHHPVAVLVDLSSAPTTWKRRLIRRLPYVIQHMFRLQPAPLPPIDPDPPLQILDRWLFDVDASPDVTPQPGGVLVCSADPDAPVPVDHLKPPP